MCGTLPEASGFGGDKYHKITMNLKNTKVIINFKYNFKILLVIPAKAGIYKLCKLDSPEYSGE